MRKTFPLAVEGKHPDRLLDATKHDIRKYLARERRRTLPEGMDYWDFDCRFGSTKETAEPAHVASLIERVDAAAKAGEPQFYVEILARAARRGPKGPSRVQRDEPSDHGDSDEAA
ncbi:MAG: hypothetical protein KA795_09385 [Burkholderiaceae bacterium]|nr:hypothetical protein [Burkholderiaceae bacterium]